MRQSHNSVRLPHNMGMIGPIGFVPSRVEQLMEIKGPGFTTKDYLDHGFDRSWIQRKALPSPPRRFVDVIHVAWWLDVPVEYLFAAAAAYEGMEVWEVAARASLEVFFSGSREGREARRYRTDFEDHISLHRESSPMTAGRWAAWFDGYQRGRSRERSESDSLERAPEGRRRRRPRR